MTVARMATSSSGSHSVTRGGSCHVAQQRVPPLRQRDRIGPDAVTRGIAGRAFERRFVLADHIVVDGADLQNGLLHVGLKRVVPEALKPRRIQIGSAAQATPVIANDSKDASQAA